MTHDIEKGFTGTVESYSTIYVYIYDINIYDIYIYMYDIYIYIYIYINDLAATKDKIIYHHAYGAGPPEAVCHGPCFSQLARLKDV